jgi:RNA polymerase sigma-70 factor, ECF subfamily
MSALANTEIARPAPGLSDERLAARVGVDATAFAELVDRYEQGLLRYTRSLLRDPHDAADAAQEAWTRALDSLRTSPVRVLSVRSWLFAIARNACMDRLRDGKRCAPADIDERALGSSPAPADVLELRDRAREALHDLAGLSERQREAVVLRELGGLDGDDLARALRTDARRASWLLTDARRSLAEVRSGRGLTCETARRQLDHRRVRTRAVRAHLAGCPECDGYARRRVASRINVHGIALLVLALPARLRGLLPSGVGATKPLGAIAAATLVAGVPAAHELSRDGGAHHARPAVAVSTPHRHVAAAAPGVSLPAAPSPRQRARVRAVAARPAAPYASSHAAAGHRAPAPAWRPALSRSAQPGAAPVASPAAPSLVRPAVKAVAGAVVATAPSAAPVVAAAADTLDRVGADL